jgi:hypothetical protein
VEEAHVLEMIKAYKFLLGYLEGKRLFERPRFRWNDNIQMDISERICAL